ncbi:MAG: DUF362 domain-containing protein [Anaerolineales bacterium]
MNKISRRGFLRLVVGALSFFGLGSLLGCKEEEKVLTKSESMARMETSVPTVTSLPTTTKTGVPTATVPRPTATWTPKPTQPAPDLVVVRNGEPEELVRKALAALGGIERFVKEGDDVIIKPNICVAYHTYEYAATTNPWVVGALVKMALGAGARRVRVMDFPFGGTAEQAYVKSGIQKQVKAAGGKMEIMAPFKFVERNIKVGKSLKKCRIYDDVLKADVLINVPIAKHHGLARLTLGMKNMMGVIYNRPQMHWDLGQRLADLNHRVKSSLVVVDAVRMLMRHGPSGGNLNDVKKADTLIATPDVVAADSYAATLFGLKPNTLEYIKAGAAMNVGRKDLENLRIEEINIG